MKRGDGQQKGGQQPAFIPQQPLPGEEEQGDCRRADQDRQEAYRQGTWPKDAYPQMQQQVVEWGMDVNGCQFQYGTEIAGGKVEAPALVPP